MIPEHKTLGVQMKIGLAREVSVLDLSGMSEKEEGGSATVCPARQKNTNEKETVEANGAPVDPGFESTLNVVDNRMETPTNGNMISAGSRNSSFVTFESTMTPVRSPSVSTSPSPHQSLLPDEGDAEDDGEPRRRTSLATKGKDKVTAGIRKIKHFTQSQKERHHPASYERRGSTTREGGIDMQRDQEDSNGLDRRGRSSITRGLFTDVVLTSPIPAILLPETTDDHVFPTFNSTDDSYGDHDQASDLILAAMDRSRRTSKDKKSSTYSSASGSTGSALAMLGRKAASIANPISAQAGHSNMIQPSQPVGTQAQAPPAITVSGVATPPTANTPTVAKAPDTSNIMFFGSRGRSGGSTEKSPKSSKVTKTSKTRSISPFFRTRRRSSLSAASISRRRDSSPPVGALSDHGGESDADTKFQPRGSNFTQGKRGDMSDDEDEDDDEEEDPETETDYDEDALSREVIGEDGWIEDVFDEETEKNTEANAVYFEGDAGGLGGGGTGTGGDGNSIGDSFGEEVEQDVLGEGELLHVPQCSSAPY
jgi:hypothetical protein